MAKSTCRPNRSLPACIAALCLFTCGALLLVAANADMASADWLCKAEEKDCSGTNSYASGTVVQASGPASFQWAPEEGIFCESSTLKAKIGPDESPFDDIVLSEVLASFSGCAFTIEVPIADCSVTTKSFPNSGRIRWSYFEENGDGWFELPGNGEIAFEASCEAPLDFECSFHLDESLSEHFFMDVRGGNPAKLIPFELYLGSESETAFFCEDEWALWEWSGQYTVTSPKPMYVSDTPAF